MFKTIHFRKDYRPDVVVAVGYGWIMEGWKEKPDHIHDQSTYSWPNQTSEMELFANGFQLVTIFVRSFIFDVWLSSECSSAYFSPLQNLKTL